jgi:hypothetical protein
MEGLGMHHPQRPHLHLRADFLLDFPQDAIEHSCSGFQPTADDLPLVRTVPGRRGQQEQACVCLEDDRLHRHGRTGKASGTLGSGQE